MAAAPVARADDADEPDARSDDEVVVRGRRAGGFVSEATIEGSRREITDAASLIEPLPGVHVRRFGADDSFSTLSVRGSTSSQVAIYFGGVPLSGGSDPTLDLATLPLWPGSRARVYRSFAPATLGRGSLGGVLVLDPPSPRTPQKTEVWGAVGSFGARRLRVGDVRGDPDGVRVASGVSASRSDNDFTYLDPNATLAAGHDVFVRRENAGHAQASGVAVVGVPVVLANGERGALTVTTLAQARRQEVPGSATAPTPTQRLDTSRLLAGLELSAPIRAGTLAASAWGRREGLAIQASPEDVRFTLGARSTDDAILATGGALGLKTRPTDALRLDARVDGSAERFAPGTWIGAPQPPSARRTSVGFGADTELRVTRALALAASGRGDVWTDSGAGEAQATDARPSGNVGVEATLGRVVAASHAGVLARPASFVERYGNRGELLGTPSLRPESAATVDVGARTSRRFGRLSLAFEAAAFATWADDLIVFVNTGAYGRAKATNIGRARLGGVEAETRAAIAGLDARVAYTGLATENESECRFGGGRCDRPPLPGRPAHDLVADAAFTRGPMKVRYGIDVVAGIQVDLTGEVAVPARVLHSAGASLAIPGVRGLTATVEVRNIFDLRAAEYAGVSGPVRAPIGDVYVYPLPGRRFLASLLYVLPGPK